MKKRLLAILILTLLLQIPGTAFALNDIPFFQDYTGSIVSEGENADIENILSENFEKTKVPVYILAVENFATEEDNPQGNDDIQVYIRNLFTTYSEFDGSVMLLISKSDRDFAIHADGELGKTLDEKAHNYIQSKFLPYLKNDDYAGGFKAFANVTAEIFSEVKPGEVFKAPLSKNWIFGSIGGGVLISIIAIFVLTSPLRSVAKKAGASEYVSKGGVNYTEDNDTFLYRNVIATKIEKNESSGSYSSSSGGSTSSGKY